MSIFYKREIVFSFIDGEKISVRELYDRFFAALCVYSGKYTQNNEASADIVQEVFIKIWNRRKDFESIYSLRSFMYMSVRNLSLNYIRDNKKTSELKEVEEKLAEADDNLIISNEVHRMIHNEIEQLPQACKKVFKLTLLDMSISEIAECLNISENTVRNQRAKSREILKSKLKNWYFLLFI